MYTYKESIMLYHSSDFRAKVLTDALGAYAENPTRELLHEVQQLCNRITRITDDHANSTGKKVRTKDDLNAYVREWRKDRYHSDAAFRERMLAQNREYNRRRKETVESSGQPFVSPRVERYKTDEEYRERQKAYSRERYNKRKEAKAAAAEEAKAGGAGGEQLPPLTA